MSAKDFMGSGSLASSSYTEQEDADPRVGLVNLADVMLVFACGLMLALVTYWNLDVSQMTEVVQADEMAEVEGIEDFADQMNAGGSNFTELGMVYQDPMTGKMYMLRDEAPEGETETGDSTGTSGQTEKTNTTGTSSQANGQSN